MTTKRKPKQSALDRLAKLSLDSFVCLTYEPRKKLKWNAWTSGPDFGDNGKGRTPDEAARNALRQIEGSL